MKICSLSLDMYYIVHIKLKHLTERRTAQMSDKVEFLLVATFAMSMLSMCFSVMTYWHIMTSNSNNDRRIMRMTRELTDLKRDLSCERSKRIKAESDAAFYSDQLYGDNMDINELLKEF